MKRLFNEILTEINNNSGRINRKFSDRDSDWVSE